MAGRQSISSAKSSTSRQKNRCTAHSGSTDFRPTRSAGSCSRRTTFLLASTGECPRDSEANQLFRQPTIDGNGPARNPQGSLDRFGSTISILNPRRSLGPAHTPRSLTVPILARKGRGGGRRRRCWMMGVVSRSHRRPSAVALRASYTSGICCTPANRPRGDGATLRCTDRGRNESHSLRDRDHGCVVQVTPRACPRAANSFPGDVSTRNHVRPFPPIRPSRPFRPVRPIRPNGPNGHTEPFRFSDFRCPVSRFPDFPIPRFGRNGRTGRISRNSPRWFRVHLPGEFDALEVEFLVAEVHLQLPAEVRDVRDEELEVGVAALREAAVVWADAEPVRAGRAAKPAQELGFWGSEGSPPTQSAIGFRHSRHSERAGIDVLEHVESNDTEDGSHHWFIHSGVEINSRGCPAQPAGSGISAVVGQRSLVGRRTKHLVQWWYRNSIEYVIRLRIHRRI
eukprot:gene7760-biopygen4139